MKYLFGEFPPNYERYQFPYQVWLKTEEGDSISDIYARGFLPLRNRAGVFYLCRSLRVDLDKFSPSSENRRICKKTDNYSYQIMPLCSRSQGKEGCLPVDDQLYDFCRYYLKERFGKEIISDIGLRSVFGGEIFNQAYVWFDGEKLIGYAVCYQNEHLLHYAHVFYHPDYAKSNLGARMMLQAVMDTQGQHKKYVYLGSIYNESAHYKLEFSGVEFFSGSSWSSNEKELKYLLQRKDDDYLFRDTDYLSEYGPLGKLISSK